MHAHNNSHFVLHKSLNDRMSKIYVFQAFLSFVKSLIGIFVPVYLYFLGFSLVNIIFYTIMVSFIYLLMMPITVKIISKIGFKFTIFLSIPFYLIHITTLNFLEVNILFFHLAWASYGLFMSIFWPAFHSEIALNGSSSKRGSQIGTLQVITTLFGSLAPLIGGFFLEFVGYTYLLLFAFIMILIGMVPMLLAEDIKLKNYDFKYKDYFIFFKSNKLNSSKKAFAAEGVENFLALIFWPILLFILINESFVLLGGLFTLISFIGIAFVVYFKSKLDRYSKSIILKKSTRMLSFVWFLRSFLVLISSFLLFLVEFIAKLVSLVYSLSFQSLFYNNATKLGAMDYIIFREFFLHLSKILFSLFVILFFYFFGENLLNFGLILFAGIIIPIWLSFLNEE